MHLNRLFSSRYSSAVCFVLLLICSPFAQSSEFNWNVSGGDWFSLSSWQDGAIPTASGTAYISNGGTATISAAGTTNTLYLGYAEGESGSAVLTGGQFTNNTQYVGFAGTGSFTQTGGSVIAYGQYLGYNASSYGTYNLQSGSLLSMFCAVGRDGSGVFNQSGGSHALYEGLTVDSSGKYFLSDGRLASSTVRVGFSGAGEFFQSGGNVETKYLSIGKQGTCVLTGGTLTISNGGVDNQGMINFGSGSSSIVASSSIINLASGGGVVTGTSGGAISLDERSLLIISENFDPNTFFSSYSNAGLLHVRGTTLTISATRSVAGSGLIDDFIDCQGSLIQNTSRPFSLLGGVLVSESGSVDLSNGCLYVNNAISGISGGQLNVYVQFVGSSGTGVFSQTGGSNVAYLQFLGASDGSLGTYQLSGGTLTVSWANVGSAGKGIFNQSGGTYSNSGNLNLGESNGSVGYYYLSGGVATANVEIIGRYGTGVFTHSGGTNSVRGLTLGEENGGAGYYSLSDGLLKSNDQCLGYAGTGAFMQTGGTNLVNGDLYLGYNEGACGSYQLKAGQLSVTNMCLSGAGQGSFTLTGGTATVSGTLSVGGIRGGSLSQSEGTIIASSLCIAYSSNSSGTYDFQGGTLITSSITSGADISFGEGFPVYHMSGGVVTFNFGGGTLQLTAATTVSIPMTLTGTNGNANVDTNGFAVTLAGALSGEGGLTKLGSGVLTLSGTESFTGGVKIKAGALVLSSTETNLTSLKVETAANTNLAISGGEHSLDAVTGCGTTAVFGDAVLTVGCLVQDTLILGGAPDFDRLELTAAPQTVPEPGLFTLLCAGFAATLPLARACSRRNSSCNFGRY